MKIKRQTTPLLNTDKIERIMFTVKKKIFLIKLMVEQNEFTQRSLHSIYNNGDFFQNKILLIFIKIIAFNICHMLRVHHKQHFPIYNNLTRKAFIAVGEEI